MSPSGLVLRSSGDPITRSILITSASRPFRVIGVSSPLLADAVQIPTDSARSHRLRLVIDPTRIPTTGAADIQITTDQPDPPVVSLSVLVLPKNQDQGAVR
ncbi:MAG: hypothetical protein IRY99_13615 [Isosphaeraceae bacterium]|nr:hypothetical protein [Isosphaeraceae bacterium]